MCSDNCCFLFCVLTAAALYPPPIQLPFTRPQCSCPLPVPNTAALYPSPIQLPFTRPQFSCPLPTPQCSCIQLTLASICRNIRQLTIAKTLTAMCIEVRRSFSSNLLYFCGSAICLFSLHAVDHTPVNDVEGTVDGHCLAHR